MVRMGREQTVTRPIKQGALDLLRNDHRQIIDLLDAYVNGQDQMEVAKKVTLVARLCKALAVHTTIEEEIFYPAIRETVDGIAMLIDIAEVQHATIKRLASDLTSTTPSLDSRYDATVAVLDKYFKDHVRLEEDQLFPKIHKTALELSALGDQMALRRREELAALGNAELQS